MRLESWTARLQNTCTNQSATFTASWFRMLRVSRNPMYRKGAKYAYRGSSWIRSRKMLDKRPSRQLNPRSPTRKKITVGEKNPPCFCVAGFRKSFEIGLRCDVVTTSPLGGLKSVDSMLRHVYQTTISNKKRPAPCLLGVGGIVSHGQCAATTSRGVARKTGRSRSTGSEACG